MINQEIFNITRQQLIIGCYFKLSFRKQYYERRSEITENEKQTIQGTRSLYADTDEYTRIINDAIKPNIL